MRTAKIACYRFAGRTQIRGTRIGRLQSKEVATVGGFEFSVTTRGLQLISLRSERLVLATLGLFSGFALGDFNLFPRVIQILSVKSGVGILLDGTLKILGSEGPIPKVLRSHSQVVQLTSF
jgi:hypothetical protein